MQEKYSYVNELIRKTEELKLEHEYQLRMQDITYTEKVKEITDQFSMQIDQIKVENSRLRMEKDKQELKFEETLQILKDDNLAAYSVTF